jgi:CheY-like chemotaxis protein
MNCVLIVEDSASDIRIAADLAASLGAATVEARTSASAAMAYLQSALDGNSPLPDLMVVDLDLGYESGFELLRFWHGNPTLSEIRLVVWTCMGEEQQEICRLFKVDAIVAKSEGFTALKRAIRPLSSEAAS